jgi:hypothetical protein
MKTMLEIVTAVRKHTDVERDYVGMCATARELAYMGVLTYDECDAFKEYIHRFKPKKIQHKGFPEYFFKMGSRKPRINFLDKRIKELEAQNENHQL